MKIAISGLNNTDNPAPGIPVIKSLLKDKSNEIIGFSYDPNEPGNYMELAKEVYLMPYPSQGFEELKARLLYIKEKHNIEAIIPNLDAELPLYIKYKKELEDLGIKTCLPSNENFELRNKNKLDNLSTSLGMVYPKTYEISSEKELEKISKEIGFPLMVKGNYYKAYMAQNLESATESFYNISNEWGFPILIQEVVKGEELNLVGVGDGKGTLVGAVAIKKLTTTEIGKIWTGVTIKNENLLNMAKEFVKQTSWEGPFELECIAGSEEVFMIEINPRFPAWVYFATEIGVNLPQLVIDIINEKEIQPMLDYPQNKMYVRYTEETVVDFTDFIKLISKKEK